MSINGSKSWAPSRGTSWTIRTWTLSEKTCRTISQTSFRKALKMSISKDLTRYTITFWTWMPANSSTSSSPKKISAGFAWTSLLMPSCIRKLGLGRRLKPTYSLPSTPTRIGIGYILPCVGSKNAMISEGYRSTRGNSTPSRIPWRCICTCQMIRTWQWARTTGPSCLIWRSL